MPNQGMEIINSDDTEKYDSCGVSYKSKWIEAEMLLNAIGATLDGEEPSDFELSYPIVRKAWEMRIQNERA